MYVAAWIASASGSDPAGPSPEAVRIYPGWVTTAWLPWGLSLGFYGSAAGTDANGSERLTGALLGSNGVVQRRRSRLPVGLPGPIALLERIGRGERGLRFRGLLLMSWRAKGSALVPVSPTRLSQVGPVGADVCFQTPPSAPNA